MFTDSNVVIRGDTRIRSQRMTVHLDGEDGHLALLFAQWTPTEVQRSLELVDQLEAALDNVVSELRLRQQEMERAAEREALGGGAGASVEADRG